MNNNTQLNLADQVTGKINKDIVVNGDKNDGSPQKSLEHTESEIEELQ